MNNWRAHFRDLKFKDTFLLASSSAFGQIISYLFLPMLGRIFSPQEFNEFALIYAVIVPLSILASFKIELSIPQYQNIEEKYAATRVAIFSILFQSILILIIIFFIYFFYPISPYWFYLPLGVISFAFPQVLNVLVTSCLEYKKNSWYRIINNLTLQLTTALLGLIGWGAHGLMVGFLVGQFIGGLIQLNGQEKYIFTSELRLIKFKDFLPYSSFLKFSTPQGIIETLQLSGTIAVLSYCFGDPIPGSYYLAWRILQAPITMISNTIFVVQYNQCSSLKIQNLSYRKKMLKIFSILFILGLLTGIGFIYLGREIFIFFLGRQHYLAGEISEMIGIWFILQFSLSPFSFIALLEKKQNILFYINIIDLILKFIGLFIGFCMEDLQIALYLYSIFSAMVMMLSGIWFFKIAR